VKYSLDAKEHRLEAHATLGFWTVERFSRDFPVAIAVRRGGDANALI
jgi:hypothetical protein